MTASGIGEQAFPALMVAANNERKKYHFGILLQLESGTKVRLRPFLQTQGMEFVESQGFVTGFQNRTPNLGRTAKFLIRLKN